MFIQSVFLNYSTSASWFDKLIAAVSDPNSLLNSWTEFLANLLGIIVPIGTVILMAIGIWKAIIAPHQTFKRFINQYYSKEDWESITKYYIPTRAQDIDPCEFDEIRENNGNFISQPLVDFFCQEAFKESSQGKYYLVLADSGMGKTTFLLRLYRECLFRLSIRKRLNVTMIGIRHFGSVQKNFE